MPIPVDETPNISLDMKEFTDKTPVHYDEMNSRHKQHLDNEKALLYPAFDDSGKVSSISSFNDFLGTIKSRMRLFDFLRNFKAGMQFVMHLGRAANNCTTTSEGLYLDARQGKVLMDLYTKLNSDLALQLLNPRSVLALQNGFTFWHDTSFGIISRCGKNVHINLLLKGNAGTPYSAICSLPFTPAVSELHTCTLNDGSYVEFRTFSNGFLFLESLTIPTSNWWPIDITYTCQ